MYIEWGVWYETSRRVTLVTVLMEFKREYLLEWFPRHGLSYLTVGLSLVLLVIL
jgi:hypothetical protein